MIEGIICARCGNPAPRRSGNQKYCADCSEVAQLETKKKSAEKHKSEYQIKERAYARETHKATQPHRAQVGLERSKAAAHEGVMWLSQQEDTNLSKVLRFAVPFDQNYSKNAIYRTGWHGHVYIRQQVRDLRQAIVEQVKSSGVKWRVNKVYLDIFVQKPHHRTDAINVLDTIADALKVGIGLDDTWFSIRRLDWEIVKDNPRIYIGIAQEDEDRYPCSYCGILQPFSEYTKNRAARYGIGSECKSCVREVRRRAKADKEQLVA